MKIEKEKLQLKPFTLSPNAQGGIVTLSGRRDSFQLTALQYSYLDVLRKDQSIESMVHFYLGQGWLVNFRELHSLVQFLVTERVIINPSIIDYFKRAQSDDVPMVFSSISAMTGTSVQVDPAQLPFFRSLDPALARHLLKGAEKFNVPAQIRLTHAGQNDRDLFIILKGQASIYKVISEHRRQMVATLNEGSLFGERGFLLNQPRNADIITTAPSEVLRVKHLAEFDQLIKTDKAASLQHRFWVMSALLSSSLFKELPTDSLDALAFAGKLVQAPANQVLFQEGQPGNTCYILIQGSAVVAKGGQQINVLNQGACFGEISLLARSEEHTSELQSH